MRIFLTLLFLCSVLLLRAQQNEVKGVIKDGAGESLPGAQVLLISLPDSAKKGTASNIDGEFTFQVPNGMYLLKIIYMGYKDYTRSVVVLDAPVVLGTLEMKENTELLKEVQVIAKVTPSVQKGDTTEFNAKAFKTNPDASAEDLVGKMPGVTTVNGKVQAQGEDVKQVLVDGKPFFGDDANAALKNLPAEVIEKIQVFDQKSDQALFTGLDDGNTTKTINIITKPNMRNGSFGRIYGGYGTDNRYKAGANVNVFKGNNRFSIISQTNNINEQNFAQEDILGALGSQGQQGSRGGGGNRGGGAGRQRQGGGGGSDASDFMVGQQNGITTTYAAGLNYSGKWGKKTDVTASYFFNNGDNHAEQHLFRQYILPGDSGLTYSENSFSDSRNTNHRFNMRFTYQMDSFNSFIVRPRLTFQQNNGSSILSGENVKSLQPWSSTNRDFSSKLLGLNFSNSILFRHRFEKEGRTWSANVTTGYNSNEGESNLRSINYYNDAALLSDTLNQSSSLDKSGWTVGANVNYTEPLTKRSRLQFEYTPDFRINTSDKTTNSYEAATADYTTLDTALSNRFDNTYFSQQFATGYSYGNEKLNLNMRVAYQLAELNNKQIFPSEVHINRTFQNVLPVASVRYNFSKTQNFRFNYRAQTNAPSVDQLQSVINNTNPLLLSTGNSNLQQDYGHNLTFRYSSSNSATSRTFFILAGGTYTQNYIGNNTFIASSDTTYNGVPLQRGAQISQPVNMDGAINARSFISYGFPLDSLKMNVNLNVGVTYTRTPGMINSRMNYANAPALNAGVVFSSNISENIDYTLSSSSSISFIDNSLQKELNSRYFNQNTRLRFNLIIWKGFFVQTDLSHQYFSGLSASYNQNFLLWNAAIGKKVFKSQSGEIRLSVFDLLKQNNFVQRNTTDTYIEDTRSNVLTQYFMLTFTYKLKSFGI